MTSATLPRRSGRLEAAVPAGEDPARYAALLARIRDASLSGSARPAAPRAVIGESWRRTLEFGVDPDVGRVLPAPVDDDAVAHRRRIGALGQVLPLLADVLMPAAEDAEHVMVVVDADGVILWRDGPRAVAHKAEDLGFRHGANWSEAAVGTNAIGTALAIDHAVQVYSAEHFVRSHHDWTCAAAPIHDPASGEMLGVVDVSGAAATVHPSTLALVDAAARLAEQHLRGQHQERLSGLRATAAPLLARTGGEAVVTDEHGWIAGSVGLAIADRIALPETLSDGPAWVPALGTCRLEPLPGGWLIRVVGDIGAIECAAHTRLRLVLGDRPHVVVRGDTAEWSRTLSPRHAQLLALLAAHPDGRTAAQLSAAIHGGPGHEVAVRAELSRLRRSLGTVLARRPYRFADWIDIVVEQS